MKKILVIDDQMDNLITIKGILKNYMPECKLMQAQSGKEGIEIAGNEQPDTILLDILMPVMDGFEVCKTLKQDQQTSFIPIIMLSALGNETKNRIKGLELGADAFLAKPFKPLELRAMINVMLRIKVAEDKLRGEKEILKETVINKDIEIKEKEQKYQSMFENMLNAFAFHEIVCDQKGKPIDYIFQEVNRGFEQMLSIERDKLLGNKVTEVMPALKNDSTDWIGIYGDIALSGKEKRFESFSESLGKWYSIYAYCPAKGYFVTIFEDITKSKEAELALKASEEQSKAVTRTATDSIISINEKGIILLWNNAAEKMFGYSHKEMINNQLSNIIPSKHISGHNSGIKRLKNCGIPKLIGKTIEVSAVNKKGDEFPIELSLSSWKSNEQQFYTAIIRDITTRKRSENIQKILYEISNAVISTNNIAGLIELARKELSILIDTTNFYVALYDANADTFSLPFIADENDEMQTFPAGKTMTSYVLRSENSLLATAYQQELLEKKGEIEFVGSRSKVWLGTPLKNEEEIIGVLAVQSYTDENAFDETDKELLEFVSHQISISINRKKIMSNLTIALKKATESDRLKSSFLQNISHEIRTPMNGILGFTSLLSQGTLSNEEKEEYLDVISVSGTRLLNTIKDIVDISMLETGQIKLNVSSFSVNKKLEMIFSLFRDEAEAKGIKLIYKALEVDTLMNSDKEKIGIILRNIVNNAIKYTTKGKVEFGCANKGDHLEFHINDTGIGIPEDRLDAIFESFVQAKIANVKVDEGTGLGLSIAKSYIKILGGKIKLTSQINIGTQVIITIPHKNNISKPQIENPISNILESKFTKKLKILVAEDDEVSFDLMTILTNDFCRELLHARNGVEALQIAQEHDDIDLILMDIKMPLMDGYETTRRIREFNKKIKIVAQTAYALAGDSRKAINAGCDDYINKPISRLKLLKSINKCFKS